MSRFNTGNPIGSGSPLDLDDNAKNLDVLVNSTVESQPDRFGRSRLSYQGMENKYNRIIDGMGLYPAEGSFETGGTITERNQYLILITAAGGNPAGGYSWAGSLPKSVPAGSNPSTTGGVNPGAWVYRSDATITASLEDGSAIIAGVTASDLIADVEYNKSISAGNSKSIGRSAGVTLIDMHYGAMRGRGLTDTETLSDSKGGYNISATAAAGQKDIVLTANTSEVFDIPLVVGQLVAYLASDGEYYSASIDSISGSSPATITLNANIEVSIAAGRNLFAFMSNEAHPIFYGYRAIADYALRKAKTVQQKITDAAIFAANSAVFTVNSTDSYDNCGSSSVLAYDVLMPTAATDGISASFTATETGGYVARVVVNTKGNPLTLQWANAGLSSSRVVSCNDVQSFDLPISVRGASEVVTLFISSSVAGAEINMLGEIQIFRTVGATPNLETCKHVLLGDSWFAQNGIFERLQERLPLANIVNKGVGGNTAVQLLSRFDTDVAPEKPDIVWVMTGTNDYYQSVPNDLFNFYINQLISKCAEIGAHLMIFNPGVGSESNRFNRSRQLANFTNYVKSSAAAPSKRRRVFNLPWITVPDGSSQWQIVNFGSYSNTFKITSYWISAGTLTVGTKTALNNPQTSPAVLTSNSYVTTDVDLSFSGGRFVDLRVANSSGAPITVYGYIEVEEP